MSQIFTRRKSTTIFFISSTSNRPTNKVSNQTTFLIVGYSQSNQHGEQSDNFITQQGEHTPSSMSPNSKVIDICPVKQSTTWYMNGENLAVSRKTNKRWEEQTNQTTQVKAYNSRGNSSTSTSLLLNSFWPWWPTIPFLVSPSWPHLLLAPVVPPKLAFWTNSKRDGTSCLIHGWKWHRKGKKQTDARI